MPDQSIADAVDGAARPPAPPAQVAEAYRRLLDRNREWAAESVRRDPEYFARHANGQKPTFLFLGCADSRVPPELATGSGPGELFVHRNVANLFQPADANFLSVLTYAVEALEVQGVVVCGHYGCGGVRASLDAAPHGFVDHWIRLVRDVAERHAEELGRLAPGPNGARERRLVELNAVAQARAVRRSPVVQAAWAAGRPVAVHAMAYDVADGRLHDLTAEIDAGVGAPGVARR